MLKRHLGICCLIAALVGCATGQPNQIAGSFSRTHDMIRTNRSESHAEFEALKADIAALNARIDHLARIESDLKLGFDDFQAKLRTFMQTVTEMTSQIQNTNSSFESGKSMTSETQDPGIDQKPEQLYQTAYNDYLNRKFDLAIIEFQEFLASFPDSELSDNAQYWIAECFYSKGNYNESINEFQKVIDNYSSGDKQLPARLKIGLAHLENGNNVEAKQKLEELMQRYPFSEEARIAEDRLSELN